MKYPAGTFLEIDDLAGARKVVLVGKDGVTFWDCVLTDQVTPLLIHPVLKPVELGTLVHFVAHAGLALAAPRVLAALRARGDGRIHDALFVMRALWRLATGPDAGAPLNEHAIAAALLHAAQQESDALRLHAYAAQYLSAQP